MRGGVEMCMAMVKSATWCGDGYDGGDECDVVWRWLWWW